MATSSEILKPFDVELFNHLSLGVVILDRRAGGIVFANRFFKTISRGHEDEIIDNIYRHLNEARQLSVRSDMKIGNTIIGYTVYKLPDARLLAFLSDISYKKIYFENKENNYFYDRLTQVIAEMVHEIGNPLTSVTTALQVLDSNIENWESAKQKEYLERAIEETSRLSRYLTKMRDFSIGEEEIELQTIHLRRVVLRVMELHKAKLKQKQIAVNYYLDPDPQVKVDDYALSQVLCNLFLNSIDILAPGGKISIIVEAVNEFFVKLVYRNNGPPIAEELKERLFMPRFHTSKKEKGIGLALSLKLMTRMGGTIEMGLPEKDWGAIFVLYIPVSNETSQVGL